MKQPSYWEDFKVPGHKLTISHAFMNSWEHWPHVTRIVLERCGIGAVEVVRREMERRIAEKDRLIRGFLAVHRATGNVDLAIDASLKSPGEN